MTSIAGKRLLILGGGLWQLEYVRRARRLGLETWVTDWSPNALARHEADHFEPIDLKDHAATLALARCARVDGVLTAADIGVPTAAFVAEQLGVPGHRPELAELATNKFLMRQRSREAGIPCPWFRLVRSVSEGDTLAVDQFPVIVKPVDNCSSRGVRWIDRPADLRPAIADALGASRLRQALVEQFLAGTEGSIEALVQDGHAIVLGICDKTKSPLPDRFDLELRYPGTFAPAVQRQLASLAQRIATGFDVRDGILHIEFLVDQQTATVHLIEFAIRGCGSKVVTHLLPALTGIDVVEVVIRQALGQRMPLPPSRTDRHGALHFLMFPPGRVRSVRGVDDARRLTGMIDVCVERMPGEEIQAVHDGRSRPGHMLVFADSRDAVQRVVDEARALIRIDYEDAVDVPPAEILEERTH